MDLKGLIATGIILIIIATYIFVTARIYNLVERINKDIEKIKKSLPPTEVKEKAKEER